MATGCAKMYEKPSSVYHTSIFDIEGYRQNAAINCRWSVRLQAACVSQCATNECTCSCCHMSFSLICENYSACSDARIMYMHHFAHNCPDSKLKCQVINNRRHYTKRVLSKWLTVIFHVFSGILHTANCYLLVCNILMTFGCRKK